jgi:hypothetical protein
MTLVAQRQQGQLLAYRTFNLSFLLFWDALAALKQENVSDNMYIQDSRGEDEELEKDKLEYGDRIE